MNAVAMSSGSRIARLLEQAPGDPLRDAYEQLIRARYAEVHGAQLLQFMPQLLGYVDAADRPLAVLGYRGASAGRLFLEQYLDAPIERALAQRGESAGPVQRLDRRRIVEVGNFVGCDRSATAELVRRLPEFLVRAGFEWLVFTGTRRVCELVASFGAPLVDLGGADATRLRDSTDRWGRYYETAPRVMAGWLGHCARVAA
jgi:hypothetical protein